MYITEDRFECVKHDIAHKAQAEVIKEIIQGLESPRSITKQDIDFLIDYFKNRLKLTSQCTSCTLVERLDGKERYLEEE